MKNFLPKKKQYDVIGLMSGTSLDGLDIAYCRFNLNKDWKYKIIAAKTYRYDKRWKHKLSSVEGKSAEELAFLHTEFGQLEGRALNFFLKEHSINKKGNLFVASHGHTIFHQPDRKFTFQLGNGAAVAAESGLPVVCDFRSADVALGGQGAPLVPVGDKLLFSNFEFCLNIGGIANISNENKERRIAFDICPANMVLNRLAGFKNKTYDRDGLIARSGIVSQKLLEQLNKLPFYEQKPPKSLGKEWVLKKIFPVLEKYNLSVEDKMRTVIEHIAIQISSVFMKTDRPYKVLVTGGGAHNTFLMGRLIELCPAEIVIPDNLTIDFKEALVFAFLGVLRIRNEVNCLSSSTGAARDNCGGALYQP